MLLTNLGDVGWFYRAQKSGHLGKGVQSLSEPSSIMNLTFRSQETTRAEPQIRVPIVLERASGDSERPPVARGKPCLDMDCDLSPLAGGRHQLLREPPGHCEQGLLGRQCRPLGRDVRCRTHASGPWTGPSPYSDRQWTRDIPTGTSSPAAPGLLMGTALPQGQVRWTVYRLLPCPQGRQRGHF